MNTNYRIDVSNKTLILQLDSPKSTVELVGGKGASLARLATAGLPVPSGFHITTYAYRRFIGENHLTDSILSAARKVQVDDPASLDTASAQIHSLITQATMPNDIADLIRQSYAKLGSDDPPIAVRSSATAEDLPEMSFAGQQETYLNVRGSDQLLEAVKRCWASLWTARAIGYRAKNNIPPEDVALAVVVQILVPADAAGILFTANPVTGARHQMVINAAWGLGEAIVGGHVTPDTFIVDKQTGAIESQELAAKEMMAVRTSEGTGEKPVPSDKRKQATLTESQAVELSKLGMRIEQLYGQPMDIEWALQDGRFFILQARPITALPEPPVALDWKLPRTGRRYARGRHAIELLPDPLSPLFATLALPLWEDASLDLAKYSFYFAEHMIPKPFFLTVNDYAYYDLTLSALQIAGMMLSLPKLMPHTVSLMRGAQARWADEARPRYAAIVSKWMERNVTEMPATQLLAGAREIVRVAADHYLTIETGILPNAYSSELLFTKVYNRFVIRKDDPSALTFMLGFDSAPIQVEKSLYDIAMWARAQPNLVGYLTRTTSDQIVTAYQSQRSPFSDADSWQEFCRRFAEHLNRFGHVVYDLDFAKSLPADDPAPLIESMKFFLAGDARSPYERQSADTFARKHAMQSLLGRLKGIRLRLFRWLVTRAQRYAPLREDALSDVGLGWPLVRHLLLEIGQRLVTANSITESNEIFWLKLDEVGAAVHVLDAGQPAQDYRFVVSKRRATWERERRVTPPFILPVKGARRFMGIDLSRIMPGQYAHTDLAASDTIKGFGASPGRIAGIARVIYGPDEFSEMQKGDILVAKIPTPAWTPLFALASGIVTDFGGPLSHSSIVAREYHIPAVLGTGVATERIHSGQRITVDGDGGVVTIDRGALPEPRVALDWKLPRPKGSYWRRNVIELLPDPLSPLFATLGLPAWNQAYHRLGKSIGLDLPDFMPEQILLTINDYTYLDAGFSVKPSARFLLAILRLVRGFSTAQERWAEAARPRYAAVVGTWAACDLHATSATQLLEGAREIVEVAAEHYLTIQSGILPMSKVSETFFPLVYNRLIKRKDDPPALTFMLGFDSMPIQTEKSLYDLALWARTQPDLANYLTQANSAEIVAAYQSSSPPISDVESWREFCRRFEEHLNRFGHAIYDLDFAKAVPADDPVPTIETVKFFLTGPRQSPHERLADSASAREEATQSIFTRLKGLRLRWFTRLLQWEHRYAPLRENALADIGLGWPLLRRVFREIGRRLTEVHAIAEPDEVFWLKVDELELAANALDANQSVQDYYRAVSERRALWERERAVTPPVNLPIKRDARVWGIDWSFESPAHTNQVVGNTIKGIGASPGSVHGIARVIHNSSEFNQMQPNDILVAKITTPAWTPLFALASGVVTDVGGILSHSSIVAREYHIPAVLGTGVATECIHSGQHITVDGDGGVVTIEG